MNVVWHLVWHVALNVSIKIDSNQKYYRFVSISVNKIDRNCVKSISIDKVYGIFTILVMNDFE